MCHDRTVTLRNAWGEFARQWIAWARTPGHDSYWQYHRVQLLELVPAAGVLTIDLGCGEGRVGRDLAALGHRVVGVDASWTMAEACVTHADPQPTIVADVATLPVRSSIADLAVAFMSLQDVDDLDGVLREAARVLVPGGRLHVAIVHPINSAGGWVSKDPTAPFVIEGSYLEPHHQIDEVERDRLSMTFHLEHRPLRVYSRALRDAGFVIELIEEPTTDDEGSRWARVPLFLHLIARRQ
jgi:SAM-dependent methyltransferase